MFLSELQACMVDTYTHSIIHVINTYPKKKNQTEILVFWVITTLFCRWYLKMEVASTSQIQSTWYYNPEKPSLKYQHTLKTSSLNPK